MGALAQFMHHFQLARFIVLTAMKLFVSNTGAIRRFTTLSLGCKQSTISAA